MEITKNLADLCVTLVDEAIGDLPSRLFATLLDKGQCTTSQLAKHTSLTRNEVARALIMLNAQNLLFFNVDKTRKAPAACLYEANPAVAYNLVRRGTVMEMIQTRYGLGAKRVASQLESLGHATVETLRSSFSSKISGTKKRKWDKDPFASDEASGPIREGTSNLRSLGQLDDVLCELLSAGILELVPASSLLSPNDQYLDTYEDMKQKHYPQDPRGAKQKDDLDRKVTEQLRELRDAPHRMRSALGRGRFKFQKIANGDIANGLEHDDGDSSLDPNLVLRVNYEKCLVELRNEELVRVAAEVIGENTALVYSALLQLSTQPVPRCRLDPIIDADQIGSGFLLGQRSVTTSAIFDNLGPSVDLSHSIGTASPDEIDMHTAERIRKNPPDNKSGTAGSDGEDGADEVEYLSDDDDGYDSEAQCQQATVPRVRSGLNGTRHSKVTFEDATPRGESRQQQMRQHLLLLCESKYQFVRHCGRGLWTVDFQPLLHQVREMELDKVIERKVGRQGVRLAQLLRKNGKLDEKMLMSLVLMRRADLHSTLQQMQVHGFADIQEVPRDNSRAANRTMFLWCCQVEKSLNELLDNSYRAMLRCLQTRQVHTVNNKVILDYVEQPHVKEDQLDNLMEKKYVVRYEQYKDMVAKFNGQLKRLDCMVSILRDY